MFRFLRSKVHGGGHRVYRRRVLRFEPLETRGMLAAGATGALADLAQITARPVLSGPYQPSQAGLAYSFDKVKGINGLAGAGQTIAIVTAYNHPRLAQDLAVFNARWGLPAPPSLLKVSQTGSTRALPVVDNQWAMETALDVQWAHAMAPGARILVVEAYSNGLNDLMAAVNYARNYPGVSVVSMSWGTNEFDGQTYYDRYFTTPAGHAGVSFVAATGDSGAPGLWPSFSANVVATGGTTLSVDTNGAISSETAWDGSGGGVSRFVRRPAYQNDVQARAYRTTPDVAYNSDPDTGYLVYNSVPYGGQSGWWQIGGTSAAAPQWAALLAVANQLRAAKNLAPLQQTPARLYAVYAASPSHFHDIVVGSNGFVARPGYDLATGLGSPNASLIISDLAGWGTSTTTAAVKRPSTAASSWIRGLMSSVYLSAPAMATSPANTVSPADAVASVNGPFADSRQTVRPIFAATSTDVLSVPGPGLVDLVSRARREPHRDATFDAAFDANSGDILRFDRSVEPRRATPLSILSASSMQGEDSADGQSPLLLPDPDGMEILGGPTQYETPEEARQALEELIRAEPAPNDTHEADDQIRWAVDAQIIESDEGGVAGLVAATVDRIMSIDDNMLEPIATAAALGLLVGRLIRLEPPTESDERGTQHRVTVGAGR